MRYPASGKLEIIRLVEQSHLPARRTLEKLGVSRATFYRWCGLSQTGGPEALEDRSPRPERVWNRQKIPFRTRRSSTRATPRGLFGNSGCITAHSKSVRSKRAIPTSMS
jgi:transposase-like protein